MISSVILTPQQPIHSPYTVACCAVLPRVIPCCACAVLCCAVQVPTTQVKKIGHQDKSTTLNTESWGYYACTGTADQVTKAANQCQNGQ
jgi:hypothetical protein